MSEDDWQSLLDRADAEMPVGCWLEGCTGEVIQVGSMVVCSSCGNRVQDI